MATNYQSYFYKSEYTLYDVSALHFCFSMPSSQNPDMKKAITFHYDRKDLGAKRWESLPYLLTSYGLKNYGSFQKVFLHFHPTLSKSLIASNLISHFLGSRCILGRPSLPSSWIYWRDYRPDLNGKRKGSPSGSSSHNRKQEEYCFGDQHGRIASRPTHGNGRDFLSCKNYDKYLSKNK